MLDISNDHLIFDNTETVTLQNQGENALIVTNVVRRPAVMQLSDSNGNSWYAAAVEFWVWKTELPVQFTPKVNAKITDYLGKHYTVDSIDDGALRTRWAIKATSLAGEGIN